MLGAQADKSFLRMLADGCFHQEFSTSFAVSFFFSFINLRFLSMFEYLKKTKTTNLSKILMDFYDKKIL